ncbi:MAG: NAD(P) transhydrogenase subunit alpha [Acidobacteria bacterium]|nr:NAD(P) transhydrogenase subunit alpha [Acidobacteriota bacterium]
MAIYKGCPMSKRSGKFTSIAVVIAAINIAGGFLVTNRVLGMFRK